jgi:hypothetical protein
VSYADKTLTCRDCGNPFTFTEGEQAFFAQKGFTNEPSRCPDCRAANKSRRNGGGSGMAYDSDRGYGGYERAPREMFEAVCTQCGGISPECRSSRAATSPSTARAASSSSAAIVNTQE